MEVALMQGRVASAQRWRPRVTPRRLLGQYRIARRPKSLVNWPRRKKVDDRPTLKCPLKAREQGHRTWSACPRVLVNQLCGGGEADPGLLTLHRARTPTRRTLTLESHE